MGVRKPFLALLIVCAACGGPSAFELGAPQKTPRALGPTLNKELGQKAKNAKGVPLVFAKTADGALVAFDVKSKKRLWTKKTRVDSRVAVTGKYVAHESKGSLIARAIDSGAERWRKELGGELVGLASDSERFVVLVNRGGTRTIRAYASEDGDELWNHSSGSEIGAPAVGRGYVFVPLQKQWVVVLDADSGAYLSRYRVTDAEIDFVEPTERGVFAGGPRGLSRLGRDAELSTRAGGSLRSEKPDALSDSQYGLNGFDPVQASYSAYDRRRILWAAARGKKGFVGDVVVFHEERYLAGVVPGTGKLSWVYLYPGNTISASGQFGDTIVAVGRDGAVLLVRPGDGAIVSRGTLGEKIVGATIDAGRLSASWVGNEENRVESLVAIVRDRDARFGRMKNFAVRKLGEIPSQEAAVALIEMSTPGGEYDDLLVAEASQSLSGRKNSKDVPLLVAGMNAKGDARCVLSCAKAMGAIPRGKLSKSDLTSAVSTLVDALEDPSVSDDALEEVLVALQKIGNGKEISSVRAFVTIHRADPRYAKDPGVVGTALDLLLQNGADAERELVTFVSRDSRSQNGVREHAQKALSKQHKKAAAQ